MKKTLLLSLTALLLTVVAGCVLTPRRTQQTAFYDLPLPQTVQPVNFLKIASVSNDTPSQNRMLFRLKDNRIVQDNLNCWIQPPEQVLRRYLTQKFHVKNTPPDRLVDLRCSINAFEFDMPGSEAVLSLKCVFKSGTIRKIALLTVREKFNSHQPDELVKAMARATEKIADKIAETALQINR